MQAEQTENELIIRETPGCLWIFGLFFAVIGGIFVYGALGGFADYPRQSPLMLAAALVMGAIGVGAGVWIIYRAPVTRVVINRVENSLVLTRYGLSGREQTIYDFDQIEKFTLIEEKDNEGDEVWFLGMKLDNDETVKISSLASHDRRFKENFVFRTNDFMFKFPQLSELINDAAGEDEKEIG